MRTVQQEVCSKLRSDSSHHASTHARECVQVHEVQRVQGATSSLWLSEINVLRMRTDYKTTFQVRRVWQDVFENLFSYKAYAWSHRREAVHMHSVQQVVQTKRVTDSAHATTHGREAVQVHSLQQSVYSDGRCY